MATYPAFLLPLACCKSILLILLYTQGKHTRISLTRTST